MPDQQSDIGKTFRALAEAGVKRISAGSALARVAFGVRVNAFDRHYICYS